MRLAGVSIMHGHAEVAVCNNNNSEGYGVCAVTETSRQASPEHAAGALARVLDDLAPDAVYVASYFRRFNPDGTSRSSLLDRALVDWCADNQRPLHVLHGKECRFNWCGRQGLMAVDLLEEARRREFAVSSPIAAGALAVLNTVVPIELRWDEPPPPCPAMSDNLPETFAPPAPLLY